LKIEEYRLKNLVKAMKVKTLMNTQSSNIVIEKARESQTRPLFNFDKLYAEIEYLRSALNMNQKIVKDIRQPLMAIITLVELGRLEKGLSHQDCNALHKAVSELQDLMQCLMISAEGTRPVNPVI
jgi:hypothetical protein